jgi:Flp pilus assembly protein TadG
MLSRRSALVRRKRQAGTVLMMVVVAAVALFGVAALATDVGHVWAARSELQAAADSSALAAAANLVNAAGTSVTLPAATTNAQTYGLANQADQTAITILASDLTFGDWNLQTAQLNTAVDLSDPEQVTAARVVARLDQTANGPVQAILARVLGRQSFPLTANATGYLGFAGSFPPGTVDLPVVIDCCKISGPACNNDYCSTVKNNPPNPCPLNSTGEMVSCLEFNSTPEQNACWSEFDGQSPSVNTPGLTDIVNSGNPITVDGNIPVYLDNGDKTPVIDDIDDRFQGTGVFNNNPHGSDIYSPPDDGLMDSWVVGIPVVECQTDDHCAGGSTDRIVGAVCFEIREIIVTPDKLIKGRFLCQGDPGFKQCGIGGAGSRSGGLNFGVRAGVPVLVQ